MAIFTLPELASYLQQDLDTATATLIQTLTDGVIAERVGVVAVPAPAGVKAVALDVAARAYRNPARLTSETVDDYTWRVDNAEDAGVYLTAGDLRRLRPSPSTVRSVRLVAYGEL